MGITLKQLTDTIAQTKSYCVNKFSHKNIETLNKLSENEDGKLCLDGTCVTEELERLHQEEIDKANAILDSINKVSV